MWDKIKAHKFRFLIYLVVFIYILFSLPLIAAWVWGQVKSQIEFDVYTQVVDQIIQQAANEQCQPFSVYSDTEGVQLINVQCLEIQANQ